VNIENPITQWPAEKRCILENVPKTAKNILEIGCGNGSLAFYFSQLFPDSRVTAIDGDIENIREARETYRNANLCFEHSLILDFDSKSDFDLVIFSDVIEHLANVGMNLESINRLTAEQGTLFISTDNAYFLKFLLANIYYCLTKRKPNLYLWHHQERYLWWGHHIYSWTLSTLCTLLSLYGYGLQRYWFTNHARSKKLNDITFDLIGTIIPCFRRKIVLELKKTNGPMILEPSTNAR
jgi:SAM-dependent methyltransferase